MGDEGEKRLGNKRPDFRIFLNDTVGYISFSILDGVLVPRDRIWFWAKSTTPRRLPCYHHHPRRRVPRAVFFREKLGTGTAKVLGQGGFKSRPR